MAGFDLFVSYRRIDAERVLPLVDALRARGLDVWLDQSAIGDFDPITDAIRDGLAQSKALLAWYSADYPKSRPCQMELTAAFIAARRGGDPRKRVWVVNPEPDATHVQPVELHDEHQPAAPSDPDGYEKLARGIADHLATLVGPLGAILPLAPPPQYGIKLAGGSRFVGRVPDLWRVHSALNGATSAVISGAASGMAQVNGMGGVGKSPLAEEYAPRFAAAWPGGIFRLRAMGNDASGASLAERAEGGACTVHALVSRCVRSHDPHPQRNEGLRSALVGALNEMLPAVADIRSHGEPGLEVLHARETCARGAYAAAGNLQQQVLDVSQRILGDKHPDTSITAWNLFVSLLESGDHPVAGLVFEKDLAWPLERDPASLGTDQTHVRQMLVDKIVQSQQDARP